MNFADALAIVLRGGWARNAMWPRDMHITAHNPGHTALMTVPYLVLTVDTDKLPWTPGPADIFGQWEADISITRL